MAERTVLLDATEAVIGAHQELIANGTVAVVSAAVSASETTPDLGFMARMMALCSLPRTNPGNRTRYVRRNGPYTLVMNAGGLSKLPFGNFPRLLLAWVCTEAVRTAGFFTGRLAGGAALLRQGGTTLKTPRRRSFQDDHDHRACAPVVSIHLAGLRGEAHARLVQSASRATQDED